MHVDLIAALDRGLTDDGEWDKTVLHVSDLRHTLDGAGCLRQLQLRLRGADERVKSLGERIRFDRGHYYHSWVVDTLRRGLPADWHIRLVQKKLEVDGLTGKVDTMLLHDSGIHRPIDWKTLRGDAFRYLTGPKSGNSIQVQGYTKALDGDRGELVYLDREGSNTPVQYPVPRADEAVAVGATTLRMAAAHPHLLPVLKPELDINVNKGPDSIKLCQPWQCDYCDYLDISCAGALPPSKRDRGIVARLALDGTLKMEPGTQDLEEIVLPLVAEERRRRGREKIEALRKAKEGGAA